MKDPIPFGDGSPQEKNLN